MGYLNNAGLSRVMAWVKTQLAGKLAISGGTMTGRAALQQDYYVHYASGTSGATGYVNILTITIGSTYQNTPIKLTLSQRGRASLSALTIVFTSVNSKDPALSSFTHTGLLEAYINKSADSTWDLYVKKTEGYDNIAVTSFEFSPYAALSTFAWKNVQTNDAIDGWTQSTLQTVTANVSGNAGTAAKLATARTMQTNLASTVAASFDGSANITPGVTGTLGIPSGGTGAVTAAAARTNLGAAGVTNYTVALPVVGWAQQADGSYSQTVTVSGITAAMEPICDISLNATLATAKAELEAYGLLSRVVTNAGSITATCFDGKPGVALNIKLKVVQ